MEHGKPGHKGKNMPPKDMPMRKPMMTPSQMAAQMRRMADMVSKMPKGMGGKSAKKRK